MPLMTIKIIITVSALIVGLASYYVFKLPQDNKIEEVAEEIIKEQTGVDIDLTPQSKERKN